MTADTVSRRHVFYLSGYDPRGARHYHALYREHAGLQSRVNGLSLNVSTRARVASHVQRWHVAEASGTQTTVDFLEWDDIIRQYWGVGVMSVFRGVALFWRDQFMTGLIARVARTSPRQLIAGFYPPIWVKLALVFAALIALAAYNIGGGVGGIAGTILGAALFYGAIVLGEKMTVFWLLRIYAFSGRWARGEVAEMDPRLDAFAAHLISVIDEGRAQEIMVVGHSVGTMLAVPMLARVLDQRPQAKISLVTLGHCIPLLSYQPTAHAFRRDLVQVANATGIEWTDYTAVTDGACFAQLDFITASGLPPALRAPRLLSPRFFKLYTPATYRRLRYNAYHMHFLYLMSTEQRGSYDYFAMTAGPQSLPRRLAEQEAA